MALTVVIPLLLALVAKSTRSEGFIKAVAYMLTLLLSGNFFAHYLYHWQSHDLTLEKSLPIQLCDAALVATLAALLTRNQHCFDLAYFWGLGGTLQAIITPNLGSDFPSFIFISFFITHSGIVIGVFFMIFAMHLRPYPISLFWVVFWSEIYLLFTLLINRWIGGNYGFLSHKPRGVSLLSFLSDWHSLYILEMNLIAVVLFLILYLPFFLMDRVSRLRGFSLESRRSVDY